MDAPNNFDKRYSHFLIMDCQNYTCSAPHHPHGLPATSQRSNLENSRTSRNGIVSDGCIATGENGVGLAANGSTALGCLRDGNGKASSDSGRPVLS